MRLGFLAYLVRGMRGGWAALVCAVVLSAAVACGDGDGGSAASDSGPGSLIVYSGRSESLVDPIIKQFADATGIDVQVKYAGTAALAATLREEGDNTPADVFFAQDPGGLGAVEDLLAPLPQAVLDLAPDWARSPDGRWVGTSGRARTIVYNTETLTEADLPTTSAT